MTQDNSRDLYKDKDSEYYRGCNKEILRFIKHDAEHILEVGCAEGRLGELIQNTSGCRVTGIELDPKAAQIAAVQLKQVLVGNIETMELPFAPQTFDHILFGDVLEHLVDPWSVLKRFSPLLKPSGSVIACIPNIGHISIIAGLLIGQFSYAKNGLLDRTHLRFFTRTGIEDLFNECGYRVGDIFEITHTTPFFDQLIIELDKTLQKYNLRTDDFSNLTRAYQYVLEAYPNILKKHIPTS
ncbi:Methyltransferase domain-containing protein [Marininema mesophilum]|uniref:Methyltransferase domain-containing protein n=1 Tax=Marininema mesophilum TaxID=1048340 RepID=A0A1H2QRH9_9BACL|nr:class I SAM-dependent methyltransferase [Marininema mesophilum]SDW09480.1 Methyltransferase domain-containing protein [Marininema mesophilum]